MIVSLFLAHFVNNVLEYLYVTDRLSLSFSFLQIQNLRSSEADKRQFVTVTSRNEEDKRRVFCQVKARAWRLTKRKCKLIFLPFPLLVLKLKYEDTYCASSMLRFDFLVLTSCLYKFITYTHSTHHTALILLPLPPSHTFLSIKADLINSCRQQGHCNS